MRLIHAVPVMNMGILCDHVRMNHVRPSTWVPGRVVLYFFICKNSELIYHPRLISFQMILVQYREAAMFIAHDYR